MIGWLLVQYRDHRSNGWADTTIERPAIDPTQADNHTTPYIHVECSSVHHNAKNVFLGGAVNIAQNKTKRNKNTQKEHQPPISRPAPQNEDRRLARRTVLPVARCSPSLLKLPHSTASSCIMNSSFAWYARSFRSRQVSKSHTFTATITSEDDSRG